MGSFKREGARMMTTTRPQPRYALDEREATMCRIADDMEREHPAWMVMYGVACRQFLGFPGSSRAGLSLRTLYRWWRLWLGRNSSSLWNETG